MQHGNRSVLGVSKHSGGSGKFGRPHPFPTDGIDLLCVRSTPYLDEAIGPFVVPAASATKGCTSPPNNIRIAHSLESVEIPFKVVDDREDPRISIAIFYKDPIQTAIKVYFDKNGAVVDASESVFQVLPGGTVQLLVTNKTTPDVPPARAAGSDVRLGSGASRVLLIKPIMVSLSSPNV